jgi:hypothetical protein
MRKEPAGRRRCQSNRIDASEHPANGGIPQRTNPALAHRTGFAIIQSCSGTMQHMEENRKVTFHVRGNQKVFAHMLVSLFAQFLRQGGIR